MVATIVSAHTFCSLRKSWFKHHVYTELTLTQSTMLPSAQLKWKQNFSYCDQIDFNKPVLKVIPLK